MSTASFVERFLVGVERSGSPAEAGNYNSDLALTTDSNGKPIAELFALQQMITEPRTNPAADRDHWERVDIRAGSELVRRSVGTKQSTPGRDLPAEGKGPGARHRSVAAERAVSRTDL